MKEVGRFSLDSQVRVIFSVEGGAPAPPFCWITQSLHPSRASARSHIQPRWGNTTAAAADPVHAFGNKPNVDGTAQGIAYPTQERQAGIVLAAFQVRKILDCVVPTRRANSRLVSTLMMRARFDLVAGPKAHRPGALAGSSSSLRLHFFVVYRLSAHSTLPFLSLLT